MAAGTIRQLTEFDPEVDSVSAYVGRVQSFLEVNNIKSEKYTPVLFKYHWGKDTHHPLEPYRTGSADGKSFS